MLADDYQQCCLNLTASYPHSYALATPSLTRQALRQAACFVVADLPIATRRHATLVPAVLAAAACLDGDPDHPAWQDWLTTAFDTQILSATQDPDTWSINHNRLTDTVDYQRLRLENPLRVMANELEQIPGVAELVRTTARLSVAQRHQRAEHGNGNRISTGTAHLADASRRRMQALRLISPPALAYTKGRPTIILAHGFGLST